MFNPLATAWFRLIGGRPAFRVHGRGRGRHVERLTDAGHGQVDVHDQRLSHFEQQAGAVGSGEPGCGNRQIEGRRRQVHEQEAATGRQ